MKRNILLVIAAVAVSLLVLHDVVAQPKPAAPAAPRVGVCDIVKVMNNADRTKDANAKFAIKAHDNETENDKRVKAIDSAEQELKEYKPGSKEFDAKLDEVTTMKINRQAWLEGQKVRETQQRMRLTEDMNKEVLAMIAQVAKEQGYHIVISSDESPMLRDADPYRQVEWRKVLYSDNTIDISDTVLTKLNLNFKK